ncbi:hypothetical protein FSP39_025151 [Pinctada imbricata]|uniref:SH2 domain-containing protein n=1 Tax=Pinctada imbricata TaxID=66713 RepID=A0AA89C2L3_PINIB|nr:hypothetical protein FSP39_025151 [Pinctada imbricata]
MLQQILQDMYVDPELLAELSDEQKHLLFVKMREEQVRRWKEREDKLEEEEKKKPRKLNHKKCNKNVGFLSGTDGKEWVWVMGEHKNDMTIEQILETEALRKAEQEAENELEELRKREEVDLKKKMVEEQHKIEEEQKRAAEDLKRKEEEAALYQSIKEAREAARKAEEEKRKSVEKERIRIEQLREKFASEKRKSLERLQKDKNRRSSEIFIKIQEGRKKMEKVAEEHSHELDENFKEQEKKAKEAQNQIQNLARKARIEYKNSMRATANVMSAANAFRKGNKPPLPPKNMDKVPANLIKKPKRPPRPPNRQAVIEWFLEEERPRGSGVESETGKICSWFHGVISRTDAEHILINQSVGSFLVRVSERVWGYTISYRADDRCKHFLVDTSEDGYQFFGANQVQHKSLEDLINFHKKNLITAIGEEKLLNPVGQQKEPPDYQELMQPRVTQSTKI